MDEDKKSRGFMDMIKDGIDYIIQSALARISPSISEGVEKVMQSLEDRIIRIEERVLRKIFSFAAIGLGAIFLVFALFFFLRDFLGWSNTAGFFLIGILMLIIGLLLNAGESKRSKI